MRAVIQRVTSAKVEVEGKVTGEIGKGFLILFGVGQEDTEADCDKLADKISKLRIFADENDKTNLSINDVGGDILCVSQFTLYADCHHGNRPSFIYAGKPEMPTDFMNTSAKSVARKFQARIEKGVFGADMKVSLLNDGPFTIILECRNGEIIP